MIKTMNIIPGSIVQLKNGNDFNGSMKVLFEVIEVEEGIVYMKTKEADSPYHTCRPVEDLEVVTMSNSALVMGEASLNSIPFLEYAIQSFSHAQTTIALALYRLEFEHKLLKRCFQGWEYKTNPSGIIAHIPAGEYYFNGLHVYIIFDAIETYKIRTMEADYEYPIPQTLDRFISDCKHAGVDLIWKQDVANQYL